MIVSVLLIHFHGNHDCKVYPSLSYNSIDTSTSYEEVASDISHHSDRSGYVKTIAEVRDSQSSNHYSDKIYPTIQTQASSRKSSHHASTGNVPYQLNDQYNSLQSDVNSYSIQVERDPPPERHIRPWSISYCQPVLSSIRSAGALIMR